MMVREASTPEELQAILQLRYAVLRQPWDQPIESATDTLETVSINAYITSEKGEVIAAGRLHENEGKTGQIRFMAVSPVHQGKGLGKQVTRFLEQKGREMGLKKIELQARDNAVEFYKSCGYAVKEKTFLLWGIIQHYLMEKTLE
jgi:N-acetylglutamate synthase-like GNAT family acetyltransferase